MANIKTPERAKELKTAFIQSAKNFKIDMSPRYGRYTVSIGESNIKDYYLVVKIRFNENDYFTTDDFILFGDFVKKYNLCLQMELNSKEILIY